MQVGPLMVAKTGHFDTKKVVNSRLPLLLGCTPAGTDAYTQNQHVTNKCLTDCTW